MKYLDMEPGIAIPKDGLKAGRFGRLDRPARPHKERRTDGFTLPPADTFGIQDDEIVEFLHALDGKQVAVIVAGTGSGKSTYLPWRLLVPPPPFPDDHLTRYGTIVVTQPRIEASTGIPEYVARKLHGSVAGPGTDIGYINSKHKDKSDSRNKLVYLTDGTLVNMIRRGELHNVSTVVIDEAHERSLNIDLILALLRRELHGLPHLKILVVSATIETKTFQDFFEPDFPTLIITMKSKGIHPVHERWWAGTELLRDSWPAQMPSRAASTVAEILRWMALDERPLDVPDTVEGYQGDILVFLTGKGPIENAITETTELITNDPDLSAISDAIELLPLYGELPEAKRARPLKPGTRRENIRYRVIYSTNLAETSLTIDGIRHVVDTGLINRTKWDPATATESMEQVPHSQHGLRQRRGRAGRTAPGVWHCLYSQAQFNALDTDTPPEITRAPLPIVVLAAAVAGVSDPRSLRWLAPGPPSGEIDRARADLRSIGAIDEHGDPTPVGRELATTRASFDDATILITADQAGCAMEAATVLAAKSDLVRGRLLLWSRKWPARAKIHVDDLHRAFLSDAIDDLDVVCRIWAGYEAQPDQESKAAWAKRHYVDPSAIADLETERRKLLEPLMAKTRTSVVRHLDLRLLPRLRAAIAWASPNALYAAERDDGSDARASAVGALRPSSGPRSDTDVIAAMRSVGRPHLDDESWVSKRPLQDSAQLVLLNREVRRRYVTPLAPPERVLQATFCVVVPDDLVFAGDDWLSALTRIPLGTAPRPVAALPGDRFIAESLPPSSSGITRRLRLLAALTPMADPTVEIEEPNDEDELEDDWNEQVEDLGSDVGGRHAATGDVPLESRDSDDSDDGTDDLEEDDATGQDLHLSVGISHFGQPLADFDAVLDPRYADYVADEPFEVVVTVVEENGRLVCIPDTRTDEFEAFAETYLGSEVGFQLDHVRVFSRDREPVLIARHPESGLVTPIDPRHIGTGLRYPQLRKLAKDATWTFRVAAVDSERLLIELSQSRETLAALSRLAGNRSPFSTQGRVVDVYLDTLFVEVIPDGTRLRATDPPIVVRAYAKDLPQAPDRIRLNATVSIILTWGKRRESVIVGQLIDFRLPSGPWELQGNRLTSTEPLTVADWQRLIDSADRINDPIDAARYRSLVTKLATQTLRQKSVRVIDHEILAATLDRGSDSAIIASILPDGALKITTPLGEQYVRAREADVYRSHGHDIGIGSIVKLYYSEAKDELANVTVHLFDPAERDRVEVGDVISGQLGKLTAKGGERHVHTPAGLEGLVGVNSLPPAHQEGDSALLRVVEKGSSGPIRMSGRHQQHRLRLTTEGAAAIQPSQAGRREPWDLRPLEYLSNGYADIVVEKTPVPPTRVTLFTDDSTEGARAASRLVSALTGVLLVQQIPSHTALRADGRAVLRELSDLHGVVLFDGQRTDARGYRDSVVWIAAPDTATANRAAAALAGVFPRVWVSGWFRRTGDQWKAAKAAVIGGGGKIRSVEALNANGTKCWRAILACQPGETPTMLALARSHCLSIPDGSFETDPGVMSPSPCPEPAARLEPHLARRSPSVGVESVTEVLPAPDPYATGQSLPQPVQASTTSAPAHPASRTAVGTGKTFDAALYSACDQLGVRPADVVHTVEAEGSRLFLRPWRVRVTTI